jgi:hypothetical protein
MVESDVETHSLHSPHAVPEGPAPDRYTLGLLVNIAGLVLEVALPDPVQGVADYSAHHGEGRLFTTYM